MVSKVYVVRDLVAEECSAPFIAKNDGIALRQYRHMLQQSVLSDFNLLCLGQFDSEKAVLSVFDTPEEVFIGLKGDK